MVPQSAAKLKTGFTGRLPIINYIHANPVRRELVNDPLDWEWSSARFWEGRGDSPLRMDEIDV